VIFRVRSLGGYTWSIAPDYGKFEVITLIDADGVSMRNVKFNGKTATGTFKAVWGARVIVYDIFDDPCILQAIGLGRPLDTRFTERLTLDYDGFLDASNTPCKRASRLLVIGQAIYAKGAE
jgi:hypothetical protein